MLFLEAPAKMQERYVHEKLGVRIEIDVKLGRQMEGGE